MYASLKYIVYLIYNTIHSSVVALLDCTLHYNVWKHHSFFYLKKTVNNEVFVRYSYIF